MTKPEAIERIKYLVKKSLKGSDEVINELAEKIYKQVVEQSLFDDRDEFLARAVSSARGYDS